MNNKGQMLLVGMMVAFFVFLVVVMLIEVFEDVVVIARDASHLNCDSTSLTTGTKLTCLVVDLYMFYFVGAVLAASVGYMFYRVSGG